MEDWAALYERSRRDSIEQEEVEVSEVRALHALRLGDMETVTIETVTIALLHVREVARRVPNVVEPRIRALDKQAGAMRDASAVRPAVREGGR